MRINIIFRVIALLFIAGFFCDGLTNNFSRQDDSGSLREKHCIFGGGAAQHFKRFEAWIREYERFNPAGCVDYSAIGGIGARDLLSGGAADFAVYELPLPGFERRPGVSFKSVRIGIVAVAPIYNLDGVSKLRLSKKTMLAIFSGEVTRWDDEVIRTDNPDVDFPSIDILLYHDLPSARFRGGASARIFMGYLTNAAMSQGLNLPTDRWPVESKGYKGAEGATGFVRNNRGALSYAPVLLHPNGFSYSALENDFGEFVEPNASSISAASQRYSVSEASSKNLPFEPASGAYPIVAPMTIYYERNGAKTSEIDRFVKWILVNGQSISKEIGEPSLSDEFVRREEQNLRN